MNAAVSRGIEWQSSGAILPMHSVLSWYASDPVTVYMNFASGDGPVEWVVARSLFIEAVEKGQSGEGDAQMVAALTDDVFVLFLASPLGEVGLKCKAREIMLFLEATLKEVPENAEDLTDEIDMTISLILESQ
jgi:hypothetical protein